MSTAFGWGDREVVRAIEETNALLRELIEAEHEANYLLRRLGATIAQKGQ